MGTDFDNWDDSHHRRSEMSTLDFPVDHDAEDCEHLDCPICEVIAYDRHLAEDCAPELCAWCLGEAEKLSPNGFITAVLLRPADELDHVDRCPGGRHTFGIESS